MHTQDDLFTGVVPFVVTAEERGFRRAAQRLGVSAAAVSKAVLRLEERLGVRLLERTSRSVTLTQEGALFLTRCREAVNNLQAGRDQLSASRRQPRGEVVVSTSFILGPVLLPQLPVLAQRYPALSLRLDLTDRLVRLVDEGVDVALRVGALEDSRLVTARLRECRWMTLGAPSYLARHGAPQKPEDLALHNCVRFVAPDGRPRDWVFRGGAVSVRGNLLLNLGTHLQDAAVAGVGLCQVLDFMAQEDLRQGRLLEVLADHAAQGPPIHAVATAGRMRSPNVRAVLEWARPLFGRA